MITKLNEVFNKIDLKKKYPGYFDLRIFRLVFLAILLIIAYDFYLNDFSFNSFKLECNTFDGKECLNPLYDCANLPFYDLLNKENSCSVYYNIQEEKKLCYKYDLCDKQFLPNGFKVGRDDDLSKYGTQIILFMFLMAFVLNHLKYYLMTGKLLPQRAK